MANFQQLLLFPLPAESLKKLQEINEEIRRLRSLSYKENVDQVRVFLIVLLV